jgi:uncharacterized phage protein (TIGR02220 family)
MARIRTIKPEFFTSEDVIALQPYARLLFIALWCEADREGRLLWKPQTFKIRYLPADTVDISSLCEEIVTRKLVRLYGNGLAFIPSFSTHQHVNPRESASRLSAPAKTKNDASSASESRVSNLQVGREGKERDIHASYDAAQSILEYLNKKAGKAFRAVKANLSVINARLTEGASVDECKSVIDAKVGQWSTDPKMQEYLRPQTLFGATKFQQYVGSLNALPAGGDSWE